jgi:hypothetical protein
MLTTCRTASYLGVKISPFDATHKWREAVYLHLFITLVLDGSEWSTSRSDYIYPGKRHLYLSNRRLGGPKTISGQSGEVKNLFPLPKF